MGGASLRPRNRAPRQDRVTTFPKAAPAWVISHHRKEARRQAVEAALRFVDRAASDRPGARSRPAWQELSFKIHAFALFSQVDRVLSLRDTDQISVAELVEKARSLDPDEIPWLMEGIGEYVTQRLFAGEEPPEHLFDDDNLPSWSLGTHRAHGAEDGSGLRSRPRGRKPDGRRLGR